MNKPKSIYKIIFLNQGRVYELYARGIYQGDMYGFIEAEELIFGEKSKLLVNPAEEKLQNEFSDVSRTFIPVHSIIRIDEVEKEGVSKIREKGEAGDNVAFLPSAPYPPNGNNRKD